MIWQINPYAFLTLGVAVVSLIIGVSAWKRRPSPGADWLALLMGTVAWYAAIYTLELSTADLGMILWWIRLEYLGIVLIGPAWVLFMLRYAGFERIFSGYRWLVLFIVPLLTVLAVWTNPWHGLFYSHVALLQRDGLFLFQPSYGPFFWLNFAYNFLAIFLGVGICLQAVSRSVSVYRNQAVVILIGAFFPMVVGILYLLQLNILPGLDMLPFSFVITGLAGLWALYRFRLLELTPIARAAVMENLKDAVLVLDTQGRVVDLNRSAQFFLEMPARQAIGRPAAELLSRWPALVTRFRGVIEASEEIMIESGSQEQQHFDLRISPLRDQRGRAIGRLVQGHDISERKRAEEALAASEASYRGLFQSVAEAIYIQDQQGLFLDVNLGAERMYGYPRSFFLGRTLEALAAPGRNDLAAAQAAVERAFAGELQQLEFWGQRADGQEFPKEVHLYPGVYFGQKVVITIARDITRRKRSEEALARRDRLLESVARAVDALVTRSTFQEGVQEALHSLGQGADVDRVYIFENHEDAISGEVFCSQRFEWVREGIAPQLPNPVLQNISYRRDVPRWYAELFADRPIRGLVRDLTLLERALLEPQEIVSILVVPVRIEGRFWGFIGYDDCRQERQWNDNELAILTAVAGSIGGAISRQKTSEALQLTQFTVDHASTATYWVDQSGRLLRVNLAACRSTGYSADELLGMRVEELDPAFPPEVWLSHWQELQARGAMTIETAHRAKDGHFYPVEISLNYLEFQGTGYNFAFARDISERKQAEEELRHHLEQLRRTLEGTVNAFSSLLDQKDPYTAGHQKRVTELALRIGRQLGLAADSLEGLKVAGSLHDIGKITIPSEILSKPAKLNEMEMLMVQGHSQASFEILRKVEFPWPVAEIVLQHHERLDGSGYPRHLKGEQILLEARILMVADVMEAICSHRPYRPALGSEVGLEELQKGRGDSFDPQVVDACRVLFAEGFSFEGEVSDG